MLQTVGYIRDINTLKIIGTIGSRQPSIYGTRGDNLTEIPDLDSKVYIRGCASVLGVKGNGMPELTFPEPREFRVVAVTPYGAYVKKWRDEDTKSLLGEAKDFTAKMWDKLV